MWDWLKMHRWMDAAWRSEFRLFGTRRNGQDVQQLMRFGRGRDLLAVLRGQCAHQCDHLRDPLRIVRQQWPVVVGHDHAFADRIAVPRDVEAFGAEAKAKFQLAVRP